MGNKPSSDSTDEKPPDKTAKIAFLSIRKKTLKAGLHCVTDAEGNHYFGELSEGQRNGKGKMFFKNGAFYKGEWKNGVPHGTGDYFYVNNTRYSGGFVKGLPDGEGTLYEVDLSVYQGEFKAGKKHGKVVWTTKSGKISRQVWKDDVLLEDRPVFRKEESKRMLEDTINLKKKMSFGSDEEFHSLGNDPLAQMKLTKKKSHRVAMNSESRLLNEQEFREAKHSYKRLPGEGPSQNNVERNSEVSRSKQPIREESEPEPDVSFEDKNRTSVQGDLLKGVGVSQLSQHLNTMSHLQNAGPETLSMIDFEDRLTSYKDTRGNLDVKHWDCEKVAEMISVFGFEKYSELFRQQKIDGKVILKLKNDDLRDMGISTMNELILFRDLIRKLNHISSSEKRNTIAFDPYGFRRELQPIKSVEGYSENASSRKTSVKDQPCPSPNAKQIADRLHRVSEKNNLVIKFFRSASTGHEEERRLLTLRSKSATMTRFVDNDEFLEKPSVKDASNICNDTFTANENLSLDDKLSNSSSSVEWANKDFTFENMEKSPELSRYIFNKQDLEFGETIGRGALGEVLRGKYLHTDVAIKVFNKFTLKGSSREQFLEEVKILSSLRSPNIVLFMGVCSNGKSYMIVTEYMEQGSLFDALHKHNFKFSFETKIEIILGISYGMCLLHDRKLLHCDLKSSNILVDSPAQR